MAKSSATAPGVHPDIKKLEKAKAEAIDAMAELAAAAEMLEFCRKDAEQAKNAYIEARKAAAHTILGEEPDFSALIR